MRQVFYIYAVFICSLAPVSWQALLAQQETPLLLRDAVNQALAKSPDHALASEDADLARSGSRQARMALLPNFAFGEVVTRGNDPVYVFGSRLRQQSFTEEDFALNALNRPPPLNNFAMRFSGNWTAFDSFHTQFEIRRADLLAKSSVTAASRSDQALIYRTVASYESVLFALRQVEVHEHDVETAKAMQVSSESRVDAGLAIEADRLTAGANLAERQQELIAAQGRVEIAWAELESAIGKTIAPEERQLRPLSELTLPQAPLSDALTVALKARTDRQSLGFQVEAENVAVRSAKSAFCPQINTFGSWETDRGSFAGPGGNNWLAGAELRIDILPLSKRENLTAAKIGLRRAESVSASADQQIRLEVTRAYYEHQAAGQMLNVARASTSQADESLRILKDRYEAGLATMTELLRVEDAQRQSRANYWQAVFRNTLTYASLRFADGTLTQDNVGDLQ